MLDHLIAEQYNIEKKLVKKLGPSQLFQVAGTKVIRALGNECPYGFILNMFSDCGLCYINQRVDTLLGYEAGKGPSNNPELLKKLMRITHCLGLIDDYDTHFETSPHRDLEQLMRLQCSDGTDKRFIFQSHALHDFSEGPLGVITLITPLAVTAPEKLNAQLITGSEDAEHLYLLYKSLNENIQLTMRYISEGLRRADIEVELGKCRQSVDGYIAALKETFEVDTLPEISYKYALFRHLCPVFEPVN